MWTEQEEDMGVQKYGADERKWVGGMDLLSRKNIYLIFLHMKNRTNNPIKLLGVRHFIAETAAEIFEGHREQRALKI